jgi:transcriptional regulator with XRE-family HTH domain
MSDTSRWVLDTGQLAAAVLTVARHREISLRDVAKETGLTPSTVTRIGQGQKPDADALVSLLFWLKADAAQFTRRRTEES